MNPTHGRPAAASVTPIESGKHRSRTIERRNRLCEDHLELVRGIAERVKALLPPSFDLGDLIGVGYLALVRAATRYRPGDHGGAPFSAYARCVVRGAMLDSVRRRHWTHATMSPIDDEPEPAFSPAIEHALDQRRLRREICEAAAHLDERSRKVLNLYYSPDEPSLRTVGEMLDASAFRVWQIHTRAVQELRGRLRDRGVTGRSDAA